MKLIAIAAGFFVLITTAHAENFLSFGEGGALTQAQTVEGYSSKHMGFDLNGQQLTSQDCHRQGDTIACDFGTGSNPLQGKNSTETFKESLVTVTHLAHGVELRFAPAP